MIFRYHMTAELTTIYRELNGMGDPDYIPCYATGRYVRMRDMHRPGFGYSISEFEVLNMFGGSPSTVSIRNTHTRCGSGG